MNKSQWKKEYGKWRYMNKAVMRYMSEEYKKWNSDNAQNAMQEIADMTNSVAPKGVFYAMLGKINQEIRPLRGECDPRIAMKLNSQAFGAIREMNS